VSPVSQPTDRASVFHTGLINEVLKTLATILFNILEGQPAFLNGALELTLIYMHMPHVLSTSSVLTK
jgi:hypothetical protein